MLTWPVKEAESCRRELRFPVKVFYGLVFLLKLQLPHPIDRWMGCNDRPPGLMPRVMHLVLTHG